MYGTSHIIQSTALNFMLETLHPADNRLQCNRTREAISEALCFGMLRNLTERDYTVRYNSIVRALPGREKCFMTSNIVIELIKRK